MQSRLSIRIVTLVLVLSVLALSVRAQSQSNQNKDEQSLTDLVQQMAAAQVKFDAVTLGKIYASDYIEVSPIGEVDPRAKALTFYIAPPTGLSGAAKPTVATDEFNIRTYGNFAIVIARFTFTQAETEATPPPLSFRVTLSCRKEKGEWKIASTQFTGIRPPRPQPAQ